MPDSKLDVVLRLQGARKFQKDASQSAGAVDKIGRSGRKTGKDLDRAGKKAEQARGRMRKLGTAAKVGGVALGGMALIAGKNAVTSTQSLTKTVIGLQRATKMDTQEAVRWATQAKVRGIEAKALNMAMGTLSRNMSKASTEGGSAADSFKLLGISQEQVRSMGGDLSKLLPVMADRFKAMGPSAKRTHAMMTLMGRGWQTITPLMSEGSGAMNEQLKLADKYGVKLGDKPIKTQKELIAVQREMQIAQLGWQVQFSTKIAPKLVKGFAAINRTSQSLRGVFNWAERHPAITKTAGALVLTSVALGKLAPLGRGLGTVGRGLDKLGKTKAGEALKKRLGDAAKGLWGRMRPGVRTAGSQTSATMGRYGTQAGNVAAGNVGGAVEKQSKTGGSRMRRGFGAAGMALGPILAAAVAAPFLDELMSRVEGFFNREASKRRRRGDKTGAKALELGKYAMPITGGLQLGKDLRKKVLGRQHGGPLRPGRTAVVGETGPEIAIGRPGGAFIQPLGKGQMDTRRLSIDGDRTTIVPVNIDGREVTRVVAKHTADKKARR